MNCYVKRQEERGEKATNMKLSPAELLTVDDWRRGLVPASDEAVAAIIFSFRLISFRADLFGL